MPGFLSLAAVLAGFDSAQSREPERFHVFAFCAVLACTTYVIVDLEFPRHGLIQLDDTANALADLKRHL
jgi:hypothetical protein